MRRLALILALLAAGALASATSASATYLTPDNTINWPGWVPFQDPHGIAVDPSGERVYVADSGRNLIQVFSDGGIPLYRLGGRGTTDGKMIYPTGVAVDSHGAVYVSDTGNGRVVKFAANGNFIRAFSVPFVFRVAASPTGRIYALTNFFGLVAVRSASGDDLGAWKADFPGKFWGYQGYDDPTNDVAAIATDTRGRVLVAGTSSQALSNPPPDCHNVDFKHNWPDPLQSGEVVRYDSAGNALGYGWLNSSPQVCIQDPYSYGIPRGLASDPNDQSIYVADGEYHIDQLPNLASSNEGVRASYFKLPHPPYDPTHASWFSTEPVDAAMDCRSNLYVLTRDRVIKYFSPAGTPSSTCKLPLGHFKQLSFSPFPLRTHHGLAFIADCGVAKCAGSLDLTAHAKNCHHGCLVARVSASFKFGRGRAHKINFSAYGLLARLLKLGAPLKLIATARNHRHKVIGQSGVVLREPSSVRVSCPSRPTVVDKTASVSGLLTPARTSPRLVVSYSTLGAPTVRHLVTPGQQGHWSDSFKPGRAGSWGVDVYWAGNGKYTAAHAGCSFVVVRGPSSLTLGCSFGFIEPDTDYTFTGTLTPPVNHSKVTLTYTRHDGTTLVHTATTGADGKYGDKFHPTGADYGNWKADAHFFGDRTRNPSNAPTCAFQVRYP